MGGRVNTDAIDNSGGVDCSDHEVNIKVLLNDVCARRDMTDKQRNALLEEMTGEVGDLVLRNNYLQTQALAAAENQAVSLLEVHSRLLRRLERDGELDREIEFLPGAEEIAERLAAGEGLRTPELSVLIAYVKIGLYQRLLDSALPDEPFVVNELRAYFPSALRERYGALMPATGSRARSSPPWWPTRWSTGAGSPSRFGSGRRPARTTRTSPGRTSRRARCTACEGRGGDRGAGQRRGG